MSDEFLIPPPANMTTYSEDRPLLYAADGTPLKRQIGFAMQTTGTNPPLHQGGKTIRTKPKGKRKGC